MAAQEYLHDRSAHILGGLSQRISARRTPIRGITLPQSSKKRLVVLALIEAICTLHLQEGMWVTVFAYHRRREFPKTGRQV
jgi:hypothetical protein